MWRSVGGGGGSGGRGGGGMLRNVQRSLRTGPPPEPFSSANSTTIATATSRNTKKSFNNNKKQSANPNTALTLSASTYVGPNENQNNGPPVFSSLINFPLSPGSGDDDTEWECLEWNENKRARLGYDDFVFGTVPSTDEVDYAVSALQQVLKPSNGEDSRTEGFYSSESEVDWIEPSVTLCNPKMLYSDGSDRVYDAFNLLQNEPSVKRMVVSLSSDQAVWDAVMNNEVVKELRGAMSRADEQGDDKGADDSNPVKDVLNWVLSNTKAMIMQLIDNIAKLMNRNEEDRGNVTPLEEKMKTSLFLSIIVLLIVVVTRFRSSRP